MDEGGSHFCREAVGSLPEFRQVDGGRTRPHDTILSAEPVKRAAPFEGDADPFRLPPAPLCCVLVLLYLSAWGGKFGPSAFASERTETPV